MRGLKSEEKLIHIGILFIFFTGALLHFAFEWFGENRIIGLFVPVNESVWEHMKLVVLPTVLWWGGIYYFYGEKLDIDADRWFTGALVSLLVSLVFMPAFFYTYKNALGFESLKLDILDSLLSVVAGQLVGAHFYKHSKGIKWWSAFLIIILIVLLFAVFTIKPLHLPIFKDNPTGMYGIRQSAYIF